MKIGELGHFHPVQPDFPAQAPRAESRVFPVILDEADIVLFQVQAELCQRAEVKFKDIGWRWLQHDLKLIVVLQPIRIFAVAAVFWPTRRLHVCSLPGFRAKRT